MRSVITTRTAATHHPVPCSSTGLHRCLALALMTVWVLAVTACSRSAAGITATGITCTPQQLAGACTQSGAVRWSDRIGSTDGVLQAGDDGSTVYVEDGAAVTAVQRDSGRILWQVQLPDYGVSTDSPSNPGGAGLRAGNHLVVIAVGFQLSPRGPEQHKLWVLDGASGHKVWEITGNACLAPVAIVDGAVVLEDPAECGGRGLQALDPRNGQTRWYASPSCMERQCYSWAVVGKVGYGQCMTLNFTTGDYLPCGLDRIDLQTGRLLPSYQTTALGQLRPLGAGLMADVSHVTTDACRGTLQVIDLADGSAVWSTEVNPCLGPLVDLGTNPSVVYITPPDTRTGLVTLEASTGKRLWSNPAGQLSAGEAVWQGYGYEEGPRVNGVRDLRDSRLRWKAPYPHADLLPLDAGHQSLSISAYCDRGGSSGGDKPGACSELWAVARNW